MSNSSDHLPTTEAQQSLEHWFINRSLWAKQPGKSPGQKTQ
ncbi:hypothetical protein [Coleofasciculus sp.]